MNFEEAGRAVNREVAKLLEYLDREVKPAMRQEMAKLLHRGSERLKKLATDLENTDS